LVEVYERLGKEKAPPRKAGPFDFRWKFIYQVAGWEISGAES